MNLRLYFGREASTRRVGIPGVAELEECMRKYAPTLLIAAVWIFAGSVSAQVFDIPLSPDQEPDGVQSDATGHCLGRLEENSFEVICRHTVQNVTAAHIHRGPTGENGPIIHPFESATSPFRGVFEFSAEDLADLQAGNLYVNVHSTANPGGEIRGQIGPPADSAVVFALEPGQETGGVTSTNTGQCMATLNALGDAFTIACSHTVADAAAAHIHSAPAGVDGDVVFGFDTPTLIFDQATPGDQRFTETYDFDDFLRDLRSEGLYVNVHSPAFPAGEIRGQIPLPPVVQYFPQFGNGGAAAEQEEGLVSSLVLTNASSSTAAEGIIRFFDGDGQPLTVGLIGPGAGAPASEIDFSIQPLGSVTINTDGAGDLVAGSAEVISNQPFGGIVRFQIPGIGIAGFGSATPLQNAIIPVRRTDELNTGVAIRNLENFPLTLTLELRGEDGASFGENATVEITIPPNGRVSQFVNEYFQDVDTTNAVGTMVISTEQGSFSAIGLEFGTQAGQFTSLPVTPVVSEPPPDEAPQ